MTLSEIGKNYKFLNQIDSPSDLKKLPLDALPTVCNEVRDFMIETITRTGGHFGAGLGVIELTVALHYVYNTPFDKIIFDVGHQGYPHKILTGRRELLHTIRQKGGLSGFLKRSESPYDTFGAGHASTSISAALGIATARDILQKKFRVVAVTGDGAMTGGLAFEAMNNCGVQKRDITVILNDNNLSINANVSAISNYFNEIFASTKMQKLRENIWNLTGKLEDLGDRIRRVASRLEDSMKTFMTPGMLFEAFGFNYFGPLDGHNVNKLVKILRLIKDIHGPILLHVITEKGKGYAPAEQDSLRLHAIGKIFSDNGEEINNSENHGNDNPPPTYSNVFGNAILELSEKEPKLVAITAAMLDGTGLDIVAEKKPEIIFDVGIAEGHAVTFAAGLATEGVIPVVAIYSTFLQRAFDQTIHDVALQNLHVVFTLDRGGLVGEDGPTHHGILDLVYLRSIPNMVIMAPKDEQEFRDMLYSATMIYKNSPVAIRYPRGRGLGVELGPMREIPFGKWELLEEGSDIAILAVGKLVNEAVLAAKILKDKDISCTIVNVRFIKPLDTEMLDRLAENFDQIITLEDGQKSGGFGSAVLEYFASKDIKKPSVFVLGLPDRFIEHGKQSELLHSLKLDSEGIADIVFEKSMVVSRQSTNNFE